MAGWRRSLRYLAAGGLPAAGAAGAAWYVSGELHNMRERVERAERALHEALGSHTARASGLTDNALCGAGPTFEPLVNVVRPATVSLECTVHTAPPPVRLDPRTLVQPPVEVQQSQGSGVIVSADGVVLTNHHVVEGASEIVVITDDGARYNASVVSQDPGCDLAALRLHKVSRELPWLPLGDASKLRTGDVVLAFGNNMGFSSTVTQGVASAVGRRQAGDLRPMIQTDAAINPGSSGGALVCARTGELVGINTMIATRSGQYAGIGFAVPCNFARPLVAAAKSRPLLGRRSQPASVPRGWDGIAPCLDARRGVVVVDRVARGSPAAKAGIQKGDVLLSVAGSPVRTVEDYLVLSGGAVPDETTEYVVAKDPSAPSRTVTVKQELAPVAQRLAMEAPVLRGSFVEGAQLLSLSPDLCWKLGIDWNTQGLMVERIAPLSTAHRIGLQAWDVLVDINGVSLASLADLDAALKGGDIRTATVMRRGHNGEWTTGTIRFSR